MDVQEKQVLKKREYQREYYIKRKQSKDFIEKRREIAKKNYQYKRTTIDCVHCQLRHRADSQRCILVENARREVSKQCVLDAFQSMTIKGEDVEE